MPTSTKSVNKKILHRRKIVLVSIAAIFLLLIVDVFLTGYLRYGYNYFKCGQKAPISVTPSLFYTDNSRYSIPGSSLYAITAQNIYYCTSDQVEADGKRPNPLSTESQQRIKA